jgi:hypothetical protein
MIPIIGRVVGASVVLTHLEENYQKCSLAFYLFLKFAFKSGDIIRIESPKLEARIPDSYYKMLFA